MIDAWVEQGMAFAGAYVIVLFRTVGLFLFVPVFGSELLPARVRFGLAAVMAFVFLPVVTTLSPPPTGIWDWLIVGVRELAAGLALGVAARVIFGAVEAAAQIVAGQTGFALAHFVDPVSGGSVVAPALFMNLLATAMFLAADLHHLLIRAIHGSYRILPPALALPSTGTLDRLSGVLGMRLFTVAVELAAPALVITVSIDVVLGLVGKSMPQIPIMIVGMPLKMVGGLVALMLLSIGVGSAIGWLGRTIASDAATIMAALAGS